jgi:MFS family permease
MALADLIGALGYGAFIAGSAVFFTRSVGLSATEVGIGLSVAGGIGLLLTVPAGRLVDRLGPLRVIVGAAPCTIALYASYAVIDSFAGFLVVVSLLGISTRLDRLSIGALIAGLLGQEDRVKVSAYLRSANNLGIALGAGLAGVALAIDTRPAYLALPIGAACTTAVMVAIRRRLPDVPPAPPRAPGEQRWAALRDRPFLALTGLFGLARIDSPILDIALPLWVVHHTDAPRPVAALLLIVNSVLVIALQVRAARGSETPAGIVRAKRLASLAMIAACGVFAASGSVPGTVAVVLLVGGMALLTAGELWISAAGWSVRYGLAKPHRQGEYGAVFSLGSSAMDMIGPAVVVILTDQYGLEGWAAIAALYALLFVAIRPAVAWAGARQA